MNHCVPDWTVQDDDSRHGLPSSANHSKSMWPEDDPVELLWQNGRVVMHSQTQRNAMNSPCEIIKQCPKPESMVRGGAVKNAASIAQEEASPWLLRYAVDGDDDEDSFDREFYQEFLCELPAITGSNPTVAAEGNEAAERGTPEKDATFLSGSVLEQADVTPCAETAMPHQSGSVGSSTVAKESSVSESNQLHNFFHPSYANADPSTSLGHERAQTDAREITITSSSGGSGCAVGRAGQPGANARNHKRKGRDADESAELQSEVETSRQSQRSPSARRRRAAEVHNLSERRRRDRINEKMKALQELIPHCNKSDKASKLDDAIEYLKSLQLQVQIMWMRSPMMFPAAAGVHHHNMLQMGMGMGHSSMPPSIHAPIPFPRILPLVLNQPVSSIPTVTHAPLCPPSNPPNFPNQMQDPHLPMLYARCLGFQHIQPPPQMMNLFAYGGANLMQQNKAALGAGSSTAPCPDHKDGDAG